MPKIVDHEETRQYIIEKAMDVFSERGYYDTTLAHIADECGMGRTTLYHYFENKDDIFTQVMLKVIGDIERECRIVVEQSELSVIDKIKTIFSRISNQCHIKRNKTGVLLDLFLLLKLRKKDMNDDIDESFSRLKGVFLELLQEGVTSKEIKTVETESMASTLYNLLEASIFKASPQKGENPQGHINNLHILLDGLKV